MSQVKSSKHHVFDLFFVFVVKGTWSGPSVVTFRRDQCVLRRASAVIACQYDINGYTATHVGWSKYQQIADVWRLVLLPISQDSQEHYRYVGNYVGDCRLQINDVQYADAGAYFFSFRTAVSEWTSETFAQLFVKGNNRNKPASKCLTRASNFTLFPVIQS